MAFVIEGRLLGVTVVEAVPAQVVNGEQRPAKDASIKLDIYDKHSKKKFKTCEVKAPLSMQKEFEDLEDEILGVPVDVFAYPMGGGADISFTLIEGVPYRIQQAEK